MVCPRRQTLCADGWRGNRGIGRILRDRPSRRETYILEPGAGKASLPPGHAAKDPWIDPRYTSTERTKPGIVVGSVSEISFGVALMPETAEQYKARFAAYVDGKDVLAMQRDAPRTLARLMADLSEERLKTKPAPGK